MSDAQVRVGFDCHVYAQEYPAAFTLRSTLSSISSGNPVACETSVPGLAFRNQYFAEHSHWSRTHGLIPDVRPIGVIEDMQNQFELVGTNKWTKLVFRHVWFYWPYLSAETAHLKDAHDDSFFVSNDATIHDWTIKDPGADDRLYQNGLDITPAAGSAVSLGPGLTIAREDAGGGDVMWHLESTPSNQYIVVSKGRDVAGDRTWAVFAVST